MNIKDTRMMISMKAIVLAGLLAGTIAYAQTPESSLCNAPAITKDLPEVLVLAAGGRGVLSFSVDDTDAPVEWYKDGEKIHGWDDETLGLTRVRSRDAGMYMAVVKNSCGQASTRECNVIIARAGVVVAQREVVYVGTIQKSTVVRKELVRAFRNEGAYPVHILSVHVFKDVDGIEIDTAGISNTLLMPGEFLSIPVTITAIKAGVQSFGIQLRTNTDVHPTTRCMYYTTANNRTEMLKANTDNLDFSTTEFGDTTTIVKQVKLTNTSAVACMVTSMHLDGYGKENFSIVEPSLTTLTIAPDSAVWVNVSYKPEYYGSLAVGLVIENSGADLSIPLTAYRNSQQESVIDIGTVAVGESKDVELTFMHDFELDLGVDEIDELDNGFAIVSTNPALPAYFGEFGSFTARVRFTPELEGAAATVIHVHWMNRSNEREFASATVVRGVATNTTGVEETPTVNAICVVNHVLVLPDMSADIAVPRGQIALFNALGEQVLACDVSQAVKGVSVAGLPRGLYWLATEGYQRVIKVTID